MKNVLIVLLVMIISFVRGQSELCFGLPNGTQFNNFNKIGKFYVCENNKAIESSCDNIQNFSALCDDECSYKHSRECITSVVPICEGKTNGVLLPNPERCDAFYICFFEISIPAICPESQYFNQEIGECDHYENVDCDINSITTTVAPNTCEHNGELFDNTKSCSHFFICINNTKTPVECPAGLYFNIRTGQCNPPDIVYWCDTLTTTTEEPFNDACVGSADGILVDNPIACDSFYFCLDEIAFPGTCQPNTVFNPQLGTCVSKENFICPSDETTTETINICDGQPNFTLLNDPRTCADYFMCFNNEPWPRTCTTGMVFQPDLLICVAYNQFECDDWFTTEQTTTTSIEIPDSCPITGTIMIPNPNRCSLFTLCSDGNKSQMACQQEYHFSFVHQECRPRESAKCSIALPICDPENSSTGPIALFDPQYCEKFHICFLGQMQQFRCNAGNHFDLTSEQCLPWEEVGCEINN